MYICDACRETFEKPKIICESHGFNDGLYEFFAVCPNCNGIGDIRKAKKCECCGEYFPADEIFLEMCSECSDDTIEEFKRLIGDNFTDKQIAYINAFYEGSVFP